MLNEQSISFTNCREALDLFKRVRERDPAVRWPPLPLLSFIGSSGSGKSAVIDHLRTTYCLASDGRIARPHAFLDFTFPHAPRKMLDILIDLRNQLRRQIDNG